MRYVVSIVMACMALWGSYSGAIAYPGVRAATLKAGELGTFFDELMPAQMRTFHIPGGEVSVVQDGRLVFARGYGYADVEGRKPIEADKTLFRMASISKLFVWTAVMQLVERGKLDLNTDVNV
jgi:CubicO group peptidase (beta-lactamase class C family)